MIQDIAPLTFHNEYRDVRPEPDDTALCYAGEQILLGGEEEIRFPKAGDLPGGGFRYLFSVDEQRFFLREGGFPVPEGFRLVHAAGTLRRARPRELAFAGIVGQHLALWYRGHRFCGACGAEMRHSETERALVCPVCGITVYPSISPAVIVAVIHNGRLLMTKYAGRPFRNYALIAGFAEIGETIEDTVRREVMEEVGLPVKRLRYYRSQPWPFSSSLLMGFFCELDGEAEDITLDRSELSEAGWFTPDEVPDDAEHVALTAEMMTVFKTHTAEQLDAFLAGR